MYDKVVFFYNNHFIDHTNNDLWLVDNMKFLTLRVCILVQEEYEAGDELGRLNCEHSYHFQCIKQWVSQKNFCPVCKQQVAARHWVTHNPTVFFGKHPSIDLCIVFHIQYKQEFSFFAVIYHFIFQNLSISYPLWGGGNYMLLSKGFLIGLRVETFAY